MPKHPVIRAAAVPLFLAILSGWPQPARGETTSETAPTPSARRLIAAGSEGVLWLVVGEWDGNQEEFNRRFLYRQVGSTRVHPVAVAPQSQRIGRYAVAGNTLHVIFQNGSHLRFNKSRRWSGHPLPDRSVPLALAGEQQGGLSRLWAVVPPETAADVDAAWRERQARKSTEPAVSSNEPSGALSISALPQPSDKLRQHRIVLYDGVAWQPGIPAPEAYAGTDRVWLAVANNRLNLFWADCDSADQIRWAVYEDGQWREGATLSSPAPVDSAAVSIMNKHVVFAALTKRPDLASVAAVQWFRPAAAPVTDAWETPTSLQDDQGRELILPVGSALGLFSDRIALLRFGEQEPELGLWIVGGTGQPDQYFEPIPAMSSVEGPAARRGVRDLMSTLIVASVLLLLFWKRQETVGSLLELPAHLQVAGPARRGLAFLIDAAPAAAVVWWIWHGAIGAFYSELNAAAQAGEPMRDAPGEVLWAWFWFRVFYAAYSVSFEMFWATTPGKRLLGCQVFSENLQPPSFLQILIRNVSRMIELEPFLKVWPFLLVVFFTRNRQRLGDLLARTIVVERQPAQIIDEVDEADET